MTYRVISIPGGFSLDIDFTKFGGAVWNSPNEKVPVGSPGWNNFSTSNSSATADMNKTYGMILENIGLLDGVIVIGHSRGGQIIYKLFRERLADLTNNVDPSRILFISSGNPERKYGGACVNNYSGDPPTYPGTQPFGNGYGVTNTGEFRLLDIARQGDRWADYPNDPLEAALDFIFGGNPWGGLSDNGYHEDYSDTPQLKSNGWPENWDEWAYWTEGSITYLVSAEECTVEPGPQTPAAVIHGGKAERNRLRHAQYLDFIDRADVELAYVRPVKVWARL